MAHAMGRTLVLPPMQDMYLLWNDKGKNNKFTFKDFFHFDSIELEHSAVEVISMEEFLQQVALTGQLHGDAKDASNIIPPKVYFPPHKNKTHWDGLQRRKQRDLWLWLRNATTTPKWDSDRCVLIFPEQLGTASVSAMKEFRHAVRPFVGRGEIIGHPTPVDGSTLDRLKEMMGNRNQLCIYGDHVQQAKVLHMMGDDSSGARMLTHFYTFLFFENWRHDLWTKRFVRDHLRYIDEIQCTAAKIVSAMRQEALKHNQKSGGIYDSFHIRRGDFQYVEQTRVEADVIYDNVKDVLVENSTIFIATDEKNASFFVPLEQHYNVFYLRDFKHLLQGVNVNYFGKADRFTLCFGC
jgi:hypothetical protein